MILDEARTDLKVPPHTRHIVLLGEGIRTFLLEVLIFISLRFPDWRAHRCYLCTIEKPYVLLFCLFSVDGSSFSIFLFRSTSLMPRIVKHVMPLQYYTAQTLACCDIRLSIRHLYTFPRHLKSSPWFLFFYRLATWTSALMLHIAHCLFAARISFVRRG